MRLQKNSLDCLWEGPSHWLHVLFQSVNNHLYVISVCDCHYLYEHLIMHAARSVYMMPHEVVIQASRELQTHWSSRSSLRPSTDPHDPKPHRTWTGQPPRTGHVTKALLKCLLWLHWRQYINWFLVLQTFELNAFLSARGRIFSSDEAVGAFGIWRLNFFN